MSGPSEADRPFLRAAVAEATIGLAEGGVPVGAALVEEGVLIATGRNRRVQQGDPIAHGEMDCLRIAGRRRNYRRTTLFTTLSPCMMCAGTIVQFGIPRVVIGENESFGGNEEFLRGRGVEVLVMNDPECRRLMQRFQTEFPEVWAEDIAD